MRSAVWIVAILLLPATASLGASLDSNVLLARPDAWYRGAEASKVVAHILSHQSLRGSWPKNLDTSKAPHEGDRAKLVGTFDNGATVGEVRVLARFQRVNDDDASRQAVVRAIDDMLSAQYPSGGWPQSSPPSKGYPRYITFNDNTVVNLLLLLREMRRSPDFAFIDADRRALAARAFDRGIGCIVACQVKVNAVPTVWCAQHDEVTLQPRPGRTFEPVSLSGSESAGLLILLMSLDEPSHEVVRAVHAGARWFESARLTGIRLVLVDGDRTIVADPNARPLWARFYEIGSNRPIFSGRDGVVKFALSEIEAERRNGYAWYGAWGEPVAARYAKWKTNHPGDGL